jgi:hypothetical protein
MYCINTVKYQLFQYAFLLMEASSLAHVLALNNVSFERWNVSHGSPTPLALQVILEMSFCCCTIHGDPALREELCSNNI